MGVAVNISSVSYVTGLATNLCEPYDGLPFDPATICAQTCWTARISCDEPLKSQCTQLRSLYDRFNLSDTAFFASVVTSVPPMDPAGGKWIVAARKSIDAALKMIPNAHGYQFFLASSAVTNYDSVVQVFQIFPYAIAVVTALVFVLVGFAFKSVVVPLRSIVSITITCTLVYGSAIFIYEDGALEWMGFQGLSRAPGQNAMCW